MWHLDERSGQAIRVCILRASILSGYVLAAWIVGQLSFTRVCQSLSAVFALAAMLDILTATWRREQAGEGSLNAWDEALTFNGVALLVHMLQRLYP